VPVINRARSSGCKNDGGGGGPQLYSPSLPMNLFEMGCFLKSRRDRLTPRDLGLHEGPRRRVAGLRRDEVANIAGAGDVNQVRASALVRPDPIASTSMRTSCSPSTFHLSFDRCPLSSNPAIP